MENDVHKKITFFNGFVKNCQKEALISVNFYLPNFYLPQRLKGVSIELKG